MAAVVRGDALQAGGLPRLVGPALERRARSGAEDQLLAGGEVRLGILPEASQWNRSSDLSRPSWRITATALLAWSSALVARVSAPSKRASGWTVLDHVADYRDGELVDQAGGVRQLCRRLLLTFVVLGMEDLFARLGHHEDALDKVLDPAGWLPAMSGSRSPLPETSTASSDTGEVVDATVVELPAGEAAGA